MEAPDEDDEGNRHCLDCGDTIPRARVEAVQAMRCVGCAGIKERGRRLARMRGTLPAILEERPDATSTPENGVLALFAAQEIHQGPKNTHGQLDEFRVVLRDTLHF